MRPRLALLCALPLLAACASGPSMKTGVFMRPLKPVGARVIAVYPYAFRWTEPPHRSLLYAMDAVSAAVAQNRLVVLAPGEFMVYREDMDDPRVSGDLPSVMARRGLPPTAFVALRGWAERRVQRTAGSVEGKGPVRSDEEVTYIAHLEVLDGELGGVILDVQGLVVRSAGAAADPLDPTPELTALHRKLVDIALDELAEKLTSRPLKPLPVTVRWLPAAALDWAPPGAPSLAATLREADAAEAALARLAVYRHADAESTETELARRLRLPGGLLVESVGPAWAGPLRPGDVIVRVGEDWTPGPQLLQQAAAWSRTGAIDLTVARGPSRVPVTVVAP